MWGNYYERPQITTNRKVCEYLGVVHEFLSLTNLSVSSATGFENRPVQDSARNKSGNKFLKDIELLEEGISKEEDGSWLKSRYTFYLAQSYRDSGNPQKALENYLKRVDMGYWAEEIYISLHQSGNIMRDLGYPREQVLQTYIRAQESSPKRGESLYGYLYFQNGFLEYGVVSTSFDDQCITNYQWIQVIVFCYNSVH